MVIKKLKKLLPVNKVAPIIILNYNYLRKLWLNGGGVYSLVVKELLHFLSHLKRGTGYAPVLQRCFPHQITFY